MSKKRFKKNIKLKLIICSFLFSCFFTSHAYSNPYGEGNLQLAENMVNYFIKYIRGRGAEKNPSDFYITLDGTMFFDNSTGSLYSVDGIYSYSHRYIDAITPDPNNPFYPFDTPDEEWYNESHLEIEYSGNGDKNVILFFLHRLDVNKKYIYLIFY